MYMIVLMGKMRSSVQEFVRETCGCVGMAAVWLMTRFSWFIILF